jgi:hypothetical protein
MIISRIGSPFRAPGLSGRSCKVTITATLPAGPLDRRCPENWNERVIEGTLLRHPSILARALGASSKDLLILRQVAQIDLYLRLKNELHLLELKRPTQHVKWQAAADQIARQWAANSAWLRKDRERVFLWAVSPIRWSRSNGTPKLPHNWAGAVKAIKRKYLRGFVDVELGLLFYSILGSSSGRILLLWRADETPPHLRGSA